MMKTKKLRGQEFRYLTKKHIKDPMSYVNNFFGCETDIHYWLRDIHLLINAGVCPEINNLHANHNNGYTCKQLIEQIEAAYVIFRQQHLDTQVVHLDFFPTQEDFNSYYNNGSYTTLGEIAPLDLIAKFFSYQKLEKWYDAMDELWMGLSYSKNEYNDRFGDRIIVIREFVTRLTQAMYDLFNKPELLNKEDQENAKASITNRKSLNKNCLAKLKEPFDYMWLDDWQRFLTFFEKSIMSSYTDWEEAFALYKPSDQALYIGVLRKLLEEIDKIVDNLYNATDEGRCLQDIFPIVNTQVKYKTKELYLKALSLSEILDCEHRLSIVFFTHPLSGWKLLLDEWLNASLHCKLLITSSEEESLPENIELLRKIIELSFLVAFRGEIEFVNQEK